MHSSACGSVMYTRITRVLFIIGTTIPLYACSPQNTLWINDADAPNVVCPNEAMAIQHAHNELHCGRLCTSEADCTSFTYDSTLGTNCYMMAVEPLSTAHCIAATNAKHYKLVTFSEFTCHPDDAAYRTYMLSDGHTFSYRIVHSLVDATTASADCVSTGGSLAKVSTVARLQTLQYIMLNCAGFGETHYYVDGSNANADDYFADDAWTWTGGETVNMSSTFWADGRPNSPERSHCIVLEGGFKNWKFNDEECTNLCNYICEKP